MTRYLDRLYAGETPTVDEWNEHLAVFHRLHPHSGNTPLSRLRTTQGENSYDFLVRSIRELRPRARAVLEIGCGDGNLLLALRGAFGDELQLAGVDASPHELERARLRVPEGQFLLGDIASIELESDAFDVVTAHYSVRAISNLDDALHELRKTLRSGGIAMFLIEAPMQSPLLARLAFLAVAAVRETHPQFAISMPATLQIEARAEFEAALKAAGFGGELTVEQDVLRGEMTITELEETMLLGYPFALLDDGLKAAIRGRWRTELARGTKELVEVEFPVLLVTVMG